MNDPDIEDVLLREPLTEFTAEVSVDIFDGNLFIAPIGWNGVRGFRIAVAGTQPAEQR